MRPPRRARKRLIMSWLTKGVVLLLLTACYAPMEPRCAVVPDSLIVKSDSAYVRIEVCR